MSIPGLGQIPVQAPQSTKRTVTLAARDEWRFVVSQPPVRVRVVSGTAERDGTELANNQTYVFGGTQSKLFSWHGCELEVDGACDSEAVEAAILSPQNTAYMASLLNLHALLSGERDASLALGRQATRLLVCGDAHSGRTSFVRTLAAWAVKTNQRVCVANTDPRDGMLTLPGTLSTAEFATIMDIECEGGGGWGDAPCSGPSAVPVKVPVVFHYGYARPGDAPAIYQELISRLAGVVASRLSSDPASRAGGLLIDTPPLTDDESGLTLDQLAHTVDEFSVNRIVLLSNNQQLRGQLARRFGSEHTTLGEPIEVVQLAPSVGAIDRTGTMMLQHMREASIKEYFFGDVRRTLSPHTMQVDCDTLTVYRCPDSGSDAQPIQKVEANGSLAHWTLAVMNANIHDPPHAVQMAPLLGFVYVSEVDVERRKIRILAPLSGRFDDRPLILGRWPEPYINLVG